MPSAMHNDHAGLAPRNIEQPLDRRRHVRYELAVPVTFLWKSQRGARRRGEGYTRDVSKHGVFVVTDCCPPAGAQVRMEVFLPPLKRGCSPVHMRAKAHVTRIDPGGRTGRSGGFAVMTEHFTLYNKSVGMARASRETVISDTPARRH